MKFVFAIEVFLAVIATATASVEYLVPPEVSTESTTEDAAETSTVDCNPEVSDCGTDPLLDIPEVPTAPPEELLEVKAFVCGKPGINNGEPTSVRYWTDDEVRVCVDVEDAYSNFYKVQDISDFRCVNGNVDRFMGSDVSTEVSTDVVGSKDVDSENVLRMSGMAIDNILPSDLTQFGGFVNCTGTAWVQRLGDTDSYMPMMPGGRARALRVSEEALDGDRDASLNSKERKLSNALRGFPFSAIILLDIRATLLLYLSPKLEPNIFPPFAEENAEEDESAVPDELMGVLP